ncbi:MAG: ERAP1-like C-terminal domain-containing protein, partial [Dokdonella sp.]
ASGKGETFAKAMRSFLDQPGVPQIRSALACTDGKPSLTLGQSRYLPFGVFAKDVPLWSVPVCARFGRGATSDTQCFLLEKAEQHFDVAGTCPDWYLPNAAARGYYRFDLSGADFGKLATAVTRLTPPEQVVYADAVSSAFKRGTLGPAAVLDAMPGLAGSDMPQVATALFDSFLWIREHLADDATRPLLDAYASRLYGPPLQQLGYQHKQSEASTATAMRTRLAYFLALDVRNPRVRSELAQQGRAALGLDGSGKVDLTRADADLRTIALQVAVQESGVPAFDAAQKELATNHDTTQRYALLSALGATRDPVLAERARNFGLTSTVQIGEMGRLYEAQIKEPENRAAMWQWLTAHYDVYRARLPVFAQPYLPKSVANGRCSNASADELSVFFAPRIKDLIGGERGLGQTVEGVRQCGALRENVGTKSLKAWAETHPAAPSEG